MNRLLFILSLLVSHFAYAQGNIDLSIQTFRAQFTKELSQALHKFDPDAIVLVKIKPKTKEYLEIPGTALFLKDAVVLDPSNRITVESVTVNVYSKFGAVPEKTLSNLVDDIAKGYSERTTINWLPLQLATDSTLPQQRKNEYPSDDLNLGSYPHPLVSAMGVGVLLFMLFGLIIGYLISKSHRDIKSAIVDIAGKLERENFGATAPKPSSSQRAGDQYSGDYRRELSQAYSSMQPESVTALFADCYWCQKDAYAAFIWKQLNMATQKDLMKTLPFCREYITFLADINPEDLNLESDPSYLEPLRIDHLDNEALTLIVRSQPGILKRISTMRQDMLTFDIRERLDLESKSDSIANTELKNLNQQSPSDLRNLNTVRVIHAVTLEDEENLLSSGSLDEAMARKIQSLIWAKFIPQEDLRDLLQTFSAQDLAAAWVGPAEILRMMELLLPEKKLRLMQSYMKINPPSRSSFASSALHQAIVQRWSQSLAKDEVGTTDDSLSKKVA